MFSPANLFASIVPRRSGHLSDLSMIHASAPFFQHHQDHQDAEDAEDISRFDAEGCLRQKLNDGKRSHFQPNLRTDFGWQPFNLGHLGHVARPCCCYRFVVSQLTGIDLFAFRHHEKCWEMTSFLRSCLGSGREKIVIASDFQSQLCPWAQDYRSC